MEYKVVIQENMDNGSVYMHNFHLDPLYIEEALHFMKLSFHSDCVFIVEYSLN